MGISMQSPITTEYSNRRLFRYLQLIEALHRLSMPNLSKASKDITQRLLLHNLPNRCLSMQSGIVWLALQARARRQRRQLEATRWQSASSLLTRQHASVLQVILTVSQWRTRQEEEQSQVPVLRSVNACFHRWHLISMQAKLVPHILLSHLQQVPGMCKPMCRRSQVHGRALQLHPQLQAAGSLRCSLVCS